MYHALGQENSGKAVFSRVNLVSKFVATLLERQAYKSGAVVFTVLDDNGTIVYQNKRSSYPFPV